MRGLGYTTQQIKNAPVGAVFVWCNSAVAYPQTLAKKLERGDLKIQPLSWLARQHVYGRKFVAVVIDHAARLDTQALEVLGYLHSHGVPVHTAYVCHNPSGA